MYDDNINYQSLVKLSKYKSCNEYVVKFKRDLCVCGLNLSNLIMFDKHRSRVRIYEDHGGLHEMLLVVIRSSGLS